MTEPLSAPSNLTTICSPSANITGDDLENDVIEVPPPMDIQAQPKLSADTNVDKITTDESPSLVSISFNPSNLSCSFSMSRTNHACFVLPIRRFFFFVFYFNQMTSKEKQ